MTLLRVPIFREMANPVTLVTKTATGKVTNPKGGSPTAGADGATARVPYCGAGGAGGGAGSATAGQSGGAGGPGAGGGGGGASSSASSSAAGGSGGNGGDGRVIVVCW